MIRITAWMSLLLGVAIADSHAGGADRAGLPGARPLELQGAIDEVMMDGLHRYIEKKIAASPEQRGKHWQRDFSSAAAYDTSVTPNRERLRHILGVVDPRPPVRMERFGEDNRGGRAGRGPGFTVWQVRWPAVEGVWGEGLLLEPDQAIASAVILPDADETPEQACGVSPGGVWTIAVPLAAAGVRALVPALVDRSDTCSGNAAVAWTNQTHREWIYRQAYMMGRHVIGYEIQKVRAATEWLKKAGPIGAKVGVAGYGEGGLLAFYSAAVEPAIDSCLVSGYFSSRQETWKEPLYRNVWSLLTEFGDAEIATLIAPRPFHVEHSRAPEIAAPPAARDGRRRVAAVGELRTPERRDVEQEFQRIGTLLPEGFQKRELFGAIPGRPAPGPASTPALDAFAKSIGVTRPLDRGAKIDGIPNGGDCTERQARQVRQMEDHVQRLIRHADRTRESFFLAKVAPWYSTRRRQWTTERNVPTEPAGPFVEKARTYREHFWNEVLGRLDGNPLPASPQSRVIYDRPKWVGHEVVLQVFPEVIAWGILLVPKDLRPGEKRPVVVCQHGRGGVPADTIDPPRKAYFGVSAALADRGYIVFAPHNPYRGEDRYRLLSRKANGVKASLFSFILAQHEQILRWLDTLPMVDSKRIGFYGCSYGGETAVRVPPLLDGYALSICSSDFNDWARKVASTDNPFSFMFSVEWEMPYFNLGSTFNYAEMVYLMFPRPFMVERGHCDSVAPDEWVAYEYAKVRYLYDMLGLGDRTEMEVFTGGHCFHQQQAFDFLDKHLRKATR